LALLVLHDPPVTPSVSVVAAPTQRLDNPEILPALGRGLTVIDFITFVVPQVFVKE
jgi:hypothetical protein